MEDFKDNLVLILAGYKQEMNWFLETNPGLRSRFPIHIQFPDYTVDQLILIAEQMLSKRQYELEEKAKQELSRILNEKLKCCHEHSGNARFVRNIVENAIRQQAVRLVRSLNLTREDLIIITDEDIKQAFEEDTTGSLYSRQ